ncbi:MAG: nucleotide-binding protein [bacterium]
MSATTAHQAAVANVEMLLVQCKSFTYDNYSHKGSSGYPESFSVDFEAWQARLNTILRRHFAAGSGVIRMLDNAMRVGTIGWGEESFEEAKSKFLAATEAALEAWRDDRFGEVSSLAVAPSAPGMLGKRVFVVHGHDDAAKAAVEILLRDLGLEPIVLHRQPDAGQTLIEKFETYSDVGYAFVLLTPDDIAYSSEQESLPEPLRAKEWRARQNVVFEYGFFVGKLGRSRVCCLFNGSVTLPSDLHGLAYKSFDKSIDEVAYGIAKELKAAGCSVSL